MNYIYNQSIKFKNYINLQFKNMPDMDKTEIVRGKQGMVYKTNYPCYPRKKQFTKL